MQSSSAPIKSVIPNGEIMRVIWTLGKSDAKKSRHFLAVQRLGKQQPLKTLLGRQVKKGRIADRNPRGKNLFIILWFPRMLMIQSATESLFSHICAKNRPNIGRNDS